MFFQTVVLSKDFSNIFFEKHPCISGPVWLKLCCSRVSCINGAFNHMLIDKVLFTYF